MSLSDAIDLATEIEGHPDNVEPAALGGLTVAVWRVDASAASGDRAAGSLGPSEEGLGDGPPSGEPRRRVVYCRLDPPKDLTLAAFVPDFRLSTEQQEPRPCCIQPGRRGLQHRQGCPSLPPVWLPETWGP